MAVADQLVSGQGLGSQLDLDQLNDVALDRDAVRFVLEDAVGLPVGVPGVTPTQGSNRATPATRKILANDETAGTGSIPNNRIFS